jgi:hypothetical protein
VADEPEQTDASSPAEVSAADLGSDWPLTVDRGTLGCEGGGAVTFTTEVGTTYAVNGLALSSTSYPDVEAIWADAPGGLKKDITPLIQRGLALC